MNKIIIALGLTLAAATGAFAQSPNDYVELNAPTHGPAAEAHAAKAGLSGVDYTATASTVRISCERPSNARNSHCKGTSSASAAVMAFRVSDDSDGGQSMRI